MPIIVDPSWVPPPPPVVVTSPDGILTVQVDAANAGVLLTADFSGDSTVAKVRFERSDGTRVRSGDTAWAPGGWANAYDHEAPLGVGVAWRVFPIHFDGTEGEPSALVAAEIPAPTSGVWIKCLADPDASLLVDVLSDTVPFSRPARGSVTDVPGSRFGVASWDRRGPLAMEGRFQTKTLARSDELEELLDTGPLLLQPAPKYGLGDFYALPGDIAWEYASDASTAALRYWTVPLGEIRRPATLDAPLMIPGRSYDQVEDGYPSYDDLAAQVEDYNALLGASSEF